MPRQLRKLQAFPEMPRDFRKCLISAIPCDIYNLLCWSKIGTHTQITIRNQDLGLDNE